MKLIKIFLGVLVFLFLGVIALFCAVHMCATWGAKPFPTLLREAESAIADAGGCDILASEASWVLAYDEPHYGHSFEKELAKNAPAIYKVREKLSQNRKWPNASLWVDEPHSVYKAAEKGAHKIEVPARVVIRFGTHSSYAWIVIFATGTTLADLPDGTVQTGTSVYVSQQKM